MREIRKPIVIVGAPRSGTNMLRDLLVSFDDFSTWPCDEINYIWRYGNVRYPSDEFTAEMAGQKTISYVRQGFEQIGVKNQARFIVEKTCANSLRVPFVDKVLPEAKYVFIRRDGLDAVSSAMSRWSAPLELPYLLRKARFVPAAHLPYYGGRYLWNRCYQIFSQNKRLAFWGPQLSDIEVLLGRHSLDEVCAIQWQRCVEASAAAFQVMDRRRWLEVSYENLVRDPVYELRKVLDFVEYSTTREQLVEAVGDVRSSSVGKGRKKLGAEKVERIQGIIGLTLNRYGYES